MTRAAAALTVLGLALAGIAGSASAKTRGQAWLDTELRAPDLKLQTDGELDLLRRFAQPWVERPGEWRSFYTGRYGPRLAGERRFSWTVTDNEPSALGAPPDPSAFTLSMAGVDPTLDLERVEVLPLWKLDLVPSSDPSLLHATTAPQCEPFQRPYRATIARYGGEFEPVELLACDGSVALDAIDRLSVLARPPGSARPELPLPLEPELDSELVGEWVPNVRLLDPRLIWVVARLSEAFPQRVIYLISGYRRDGHDSFHTRGRALDLFVMGVKNEDVFRVCRTLKDVGCGFYPNNNFIHVDVRPPATGHALWVDVSKPGQPSRYVDSWPGLVESGALSWGKAE